MLTEFFSKLKEIVKLNPQLSQRCEDILIHYYYVVLVLLLFLTVAAFVFSFRFIFQEMKKISLRSWFLIILIFNLALILRFFVIEHSPQVFFDEVTFIETAENYHTGGLNMQNYHGPLRNQLLICTTGWPFLISLAFKITGLNIQTAYYLSALLSSLTVLLVFLTGTLLFKNENAGLWSALIFCLYPVFLRLSTSSAMGTSSLFFIFLTLLAFLLYFRQQKTPLLYFSFCSLAWTSNMRQEAILTLLPLLLLFFALFHPNLRSEFKKIHIYLCLGLCGFFALPAALASFYGVSTGFYFFYETPAQMNNDIIHNLQYNLTYWLSNRIQPLSVMLMALFSFAMFFKIDRRLCFFFGGWFVFLWFFYSLNPSCDFSAIRTLDSWRNVFHLLVPVVLFAGLAPVIIQEYFVNNYKKLAPIALILLIVAILSIPVQFRKFIEQRTIYARENLFISNFSSRLPPESRIIVDGKMHPTVRESYMSLFRYTSKVPGFHHYVDPFLPYSTRPLFRDINRWRNVEHRPVFLYLTNFNMGTVRSTYGWYFDTFQLKLIAGFGSQDHGGSYALYEITGIKKLPDIFGKKDEERTDGETPPDADSHVKFIEQDAESGKTPRGSEPQTEKNILPEGSEDAF